MFTDVTKAIQESIGKTPIEWAKALLWQGDKAVALREAAREIKLENLGNKVYLRGLIEYSNICEKNCYYCGIRKENNDVKRYVVEDNEVLEAVSFAYEQGFGSIVLQSGEGQDSNFVARIERIIKEIMRISNQSIGITLSLGEQSLETYRRWREAGAKRYLLRIETSNKELYKRLHPLDHTFEQRLRSLEYLKQAGYQVGTGIMIGLPWQTVDDLASDLSFIKNLEIDMVGMGPYIEHQKTPLYDHRHILPSIKERYELSLNMYALLRCIMPDINIASTTALASLDKNGREEALRIAANVIMPNITPLAYRENYFLYENKLCICESKEDSKTNIESLIKKAGCVPAYFEQGDSKHYFKRVSKEL